MNSLGMCVRRSAISVLAYGALVLAVACGGHPSPAGTPAAPASLSAAGPLLGSLTSAVPGLSHTQAQVGAGALLGLARARMPEGQYTQVAGAIPGADALLDEAVKRGLPSGITQMSDVTMFLRRSGVESEQVTRMVPVLTEAVEGKVSPQAALGFFSALSSVR
jgi:hypothetical protein